MGGRCGSHTHQGKRECLLHLSCEDHHEGTQGKCSEGSSLRLNLTVTLITVTIRW